MHMAEATAVLGRNSSSRRPEAQDRRVSSMLGYKAKAVHKGCDLAWSAEQHILLFPTVLHEPHSLLENRTRGKSLKTLSFSEAQSYL